MVSSYAISGPLGSHVVERSAISGHWAVYSTEEVGTNWRVIVGSNGTSRYVLRSESGVIVARTLRLAAVETKWGEHFVRTRKNFTISDDALPATGTVIVVGNRVGYLSWFGGAPEYSGSNIDGGVIHKVYVSGPHRRKGLASAMLDYARDTFPDKDVRHSDALTDDGAAWAAARPTPNDLRSRKTAA